MRTNQLSHYKVIIAIGVLILVGLLLLPVLGLTGFHIFLVSKGRTTNEQVTSKYDLDMNPYDRGLYKNWMNIFCTSQLPLLNRSNVVEVDMWGISYNGKSIHHLQASDFRSSLNNSELPNNCKPSDDSANAVKENAIVCEKTDSRNKINHATEQQNTVDDVVAGVHRDLDSSVLPNANGKNISVTDSPNALVIAADQEMVSRSQSPVHGRSGEIKVNSNPSSLGIKSKLVGNKDQGKGQQTDTYTPKHIANLHSMGVDSVSAAQTGGNVQMEIMSNRDHFATAGDHKTPLLRSHENSDVELIRGRQLQKFTSDNQSKSSNSLQRKQQEQGITVGIGRSSSRDFNPSRSNENTCSRTSSTSMMNLRDRVNLPVDTNPATFSQSRYGTAQDLNVAPSSPKSHSPLTVRDMHHGLSGVHTSNPQFVNYPHNNMSKGFMKSVRSDHRRHPPTHQVSRTPGTQGNQKHVLSHHSGAIHQLPPHSSHGLPPPLPPHGSQMSIPHVRPMWSPVVPPHGLSVSSQYFSPFDTTSHLSDSAPISHLRLVRPPYFGNPNICPVDESHFFIDNTRLNESSVSKHISQSFASAYNPSVITQASSRPTPPLPPHNRIVRSNAPNNRMQLTGPKNSNHLIPGWQLEGDSSSPDGTFEISV
ncbi:unnamed protein product [Trichobilharzia szidati]|nr:unnamed protein product [Trichobilharzia szidati]